MKTITTIFTFTIVALLTTCLRGQTDFIVSATNGVLVDDFNFEFDIYILSTGTEPLELASFQTAIYFNDAISNSGSLSAVFISGTSTLSNSNQYPNPPNLNYINNDGTIRQFRIAPRTPPGSNNGSLISNVTPGTRFGRFRITNTMAFNKTTPVNWQWNFLTGAEQYSSYINIYKDSINTNTSGLSIFLIDLPDPLKPANMDIPLTVYDDSGEIKTLNLGYDLEATTGIDPDLGEIELPAFPPAGAFEARFDLAPYGVGNISTYKDYRNIPALPFTGMHEHRLKWQLGSGATFLGIDYFLPEGVTMNLMDPFGGVLYNSGELTGTGTYIIPYPYASLNDAKVTMYYTSIIHNVPVFNVAPDSLNFGNVSYPGGYLTLPVTVSNVGNASLNILGIASSDAEFTFAPNTFPILIPEGGYAIFNVIFTPSAIGTKKGNLTFIHNALGSLTSYSVEGVGVSLPVMPYSENFEGFTAGQKVACQDPINWTTWNNLPCDSTEDAYISSTYSFSGTKSVKILHNNDLVRPLLAQNSGKWRISFMHYIPVGKTGYFNTFALLAGVNSRWAMECYFNAGGAGSLNAGGVNTASFTWISNSWKKVDVVVDLDNDIAEFWYDNLMVYSWQWTLGAIGSGCPLQLGATNFFGATANEEMYFDDYKIELASSTFPLSVLVTDGWNMVSVPGLHPVDQNVSTWWPNRNTLADVYKWTTTYEAVTLTAPTQGYWMLHTGAQTYNYPAIQIVPHDPIPLTAGWNMIGGYENTPLVNGLTTTPANLIVPGTVYGWTGTYSNATNLVPGYGYWVLSNGNGVINPPTLAEGSAKIVVQDDKSEWGKITITDASGKSYTLYTVNGEVNLDQYQMPPLPPTGMFDVRYSSNRKAENLKENNQTIEMRGLVYPVTVRVEKMGIKLEDETGKLISERIKSGEEVVISNSAVSKLKVSGDIIPDKYALEQNYPNPFNPSTKIEFSIPEDVNNVTLTIYNTLGQKVAELVNSKMEAGKYSYVWNASDVATGLYIYELRTNKFVSVKKMLLLK